MIPIKMRESKRHDGMVCSLGKLQAKSCSKLSDKTSVDNISLRSIHSKYAKMKRETESMWSISANKIVSTQMHTGPSNILEKERR
jgi:hypothetical protein